MLQCEQGNSGYESCVTYPTNDASHLCSNPDALPIVGLSPLGTVRRCWAEDLVKDHCIDLVRVFQSSAPSVPGNGSIDRSVVELHQKCRYIIVNVCVGCISGGTLAPTIKEYISRIVGVNLVNKSQSTLSSSDAVTILYVYD